MHNFYFTIQNSYRITFLFLKFPCFKLNSVIVSRIYYDCSVLPGCPGNDEEERKEETGKNAEGEGEEGGWGGGQ